MFKRKGNRGIPKRVLMDVVSDYLPVSSLICFSLCEIWSSRDCKSSSLWRIISSCSWIISSFLNITPASTQIGQAIRKWIRVYLSNVFIMKYHNTNITLHLNKSVALSGLGSVSRSRLLETKSKLLVQLWQFAVEVANIRKLSSSCLSAQSRWRPVRTNCLNACS